MTPISRRRAVTTLAGGVTTVLAGCAGRADSESEEDGESGSRHIESITTERRANPRVVDLVVQLVADHGASRFVVVDGTGSVVFQTTLRASQRTVRVPLEDGVDAILQPVAAVETLDHEFVLYDGETELSRQAWRPTIALDYAFELGNDSDVEIANSLRITLRNDSDIRMRPLRAAIVAGFPTAVHDSERVGELAATDPTWAAGWESTYRLVADHPDLGSNLLAPPEGECGSGPHSITLRIEYEQFVVDRIRLEVSLGGEPRQYRAENGMASVYCSQPTVESWELVKRTVSV